MSIKPDKKDDNRPKGDNAVPTAYFGAGATGIGSKIGRYRLLSVLGEGGCSIVYSAEQQRPVKRRVALKIIKPGMDTKQVIARFEAERQALALLDHPNIAHVFDAGTTVTGRPYFVMEYLKGIPITEHCDLAKLAIDERLNLFLKVCEAVQYAHQKGIIHRDIKPSNLQVVIHGKQAVPKIIDFGVAKANSQPLTKRSLITEHGQFFGTPEYMSPEQAEMTGQDIDTRSDIYSLGVVLYEMLTGVLPFDSSTLREGGVDHIRKIIREEEPKTTSTRLNTISSEESVKVARLRHTDIGTLGRKLHGDLEWITIKAMAKDRTRRYQTAHALAEDIQRHLNHEPVLAGPPSTIYRIRKFLRKYRTQTIAVAEEEILVFALSSIFVMYVQFLNRGKEAEFLKDKDILWQVREAFSEWDLVTALKEVESILDSKHVGTDARLLYAGILVEGGYPVQAEVELQKLLTEGPEVAGAAHSLLARIYWEGNLSDDEKVQKVHAHRRHAEELLPESAEAYFLQALTAPTIKEKLGFINKALELDPGHYESLKLRTWTHYASRNYEDMEDDALSMIISRPKTAQGYSLRGIAQREQSKFQEALKSFRQALQLIDTEDSQRIDLCRQQCETYLRWGDYHRLISYAKASRSQFPDELKFAFYIFCAHVAIGDYDQAISVFQKAAQSDPKNKDRFICWSMKHVFDTKAVKRAWHPTGTTLPERLPFILMQEAEESYREYASKKADRVISDGFHAAWSPDGSKLAYSAGFHGCSGLAIYDMETEKTKLLIVPGKDPKWSPDGKYIAFVRDCQILPVSKFASAERAFKQSSCEREKVWVIRADGTKPRLLAEGAGWPSWSSDSKHVFYQSRLQCKIHRISVVNPDASPNSVCPMGSHFPSVSMDGLNGPHMAYVNDYLHELRIAKLSSPQNIIASWTVLPDIWSGNWSPTGNQLCAGLGFGGGTYPTGLWGFDLRTGQATKVLSGWVIDGCWSFDEKQFGFFVGPPFYEIWIAKADSLGSGQTEKEHHEKAIVHYTRLIEADPAEMTNYAWRATHGIYLGDHETVLKDATIMLQNNSCQMPVPYYRLASLLIALDNTIDPEVAVRLARKSVENAQPQTDLYWNAVTTLAVAYYRAGHWDKAKDELGKKVKFYRANASDYFCLAMAYWHLDEREKAQEEYSKGFKEMEKTRGEYYRVRHFRAEAEALLAR